MMKNKKLFCGILLVMIIVIGGIILFMYLSRPTPSVLPEVPESKINLSRPTPSVLPEVPESKIILRQIYPQILPEECANKFYITETADYIIEGIVKKVESKWDEERTFIFTDIDVKIEKYLKGTPFKEDTLYMMMPGGKVGEIVQQWVEDQPIFHKGKRVRIYFQKVNGEFFIVCGRMGIEEIDLVGFEKIILFENGKQTTLDSFQQPDLLSKMGNLLTQEIQKINVKAKCLFTERDIREIKQKDRAIELIFKEPKNISPSKGFESLENVKTAIFILEDKRGKGLVGHILIGSERKERDEKCFWRVTEEQQKKLGLCAAIIGAEWIEEAGYCGGVGGCGFDPEIVPFRTYEECEFACGKIWSCWAILKEKEKDLDKSWIDKINSLLGKPPEKYAGRSTYGPCQADNDCYISGCNSELCQSKNEDPLSSICIVPDKPTPKELNYECKCVNQKCQWSK